MTVISGHTTRANGTILTAAIYNIDHVNHVTNAQNLNADKMEGATPPVVDGHAAVWDGTAGNALRTSGFAPVTSARQIIAGTGMTGGGNLTADRTMGVDFAVQSEAEGGIITDAAMSPLGTAQRIASMKATIAQVRSAAADRLFMTDLIETASAFVTLSEAATIALDWDAFINATVTISANRILGNPTNGQSGTWRVVCVDGNDATDRTLTFGNQYFGEVPTIVDIDVGRTYMISIFCRAANWFSASAKRI